MNTVEPITNTLQDRNKDILVIDELPALKPKVVGTRTGNGSLLHKEVQREEIHAPVDESLIPLDVVVDASNKRLSQEESDRNKGDQCWKKKRVRPNPEGVVEVQSVDSPSRTLTACNEKPNNIGALQRGRPQDSGKSIVRPDPQKSSSTAKANQEATSISRGGIGAKLGSDLHEQPTRKLKGSDADKVSELEEDTKVILEAIDGDDVDISSLRNLLESLLELVASYNKTRSALSDKFKKTAISEVEVHLTTTSGTKPFVGISLKSFTAAIYLS
ncbi:hypothetical protein A4A49_07344 [Nicotiana attenuata]|uniref:Uncharacterized protein n=1 Tax=Nicotiana attenuata TaxID=49451 RepID=A0A314KSQ3_NICAT|nr:hypothetical protein A4A49_07344 [Nicotiana attenuata]